jgi:hypothetical protein
MGFKLHGTFLDAGLPEPRMRAQSVIETGPDAAQSLVSAIRSLMPALLKSGAAAEGGLDVDALEAGLRDEFMRDRRIGLPALVVDAWARKP